MEHHKPDPELPPIPAKRYFTNSEVCDLCGVKAHVLRNWEQEFAQLNPVKRSGNRRYYQHHEVVLIRRIRELLFDQGFTISGARNRLGGLPGSANSSETDDQTGSCYENGMSQQDVAAVKREILDIIAMLDA
ncbi:MAG: MerR family transcriptional regulator [Gallionella sp.]|nr:MerR family transcriptional regulator [Gallionella sp.]